MSLMGSGLGRAAGGGSFLDSCRSCSYSTSFMSKISLMRHLRKSSTFEHGPSLGFDTHEPHRTAQLPALVLQARLCDIHLAQR